MFLKIIKAEHKQTNMLYYSPLRYPGGKRKLAKFIALLCSTNKINGIYVEPYAGGASVALHLLIKGHIQEVIINDYDRSLYAFWHSVLNNTAELCEMIEYAELTIENWYRQREIQKKKGK